MLIFFQMRITNPDTAVSAFIIKTPSSGNPFINH